MLARLLSGLRAASQDVRPDEVERALREDRRHGGEANDLAEQALNERAQAAAEKARRDRERDRQQP